MKPNPCVQKKPYFKNPDKPIVKKQSQEQVKAQREAVLKAQREAMPNLVSGYLQELDEREKSMKEKSKTRTSNGKDLAFICNLCGKEG